MGPETAAAPPVDGITPLNFVYSCSYCSSTFADVYEDHNETVRGLSDRINPKDRLVTRMFLATCCHVFCSNHLEGGGPPFHAEGQRPQAPCPVCSQEKGDTEPRDLYSVRGFGPHEADPQIPSEWFTAPPIQVNGSGPDMEAWNFQYLALTRYCQNTYASRKQQQDTLKATQHELVMMQDRASEEHAKCLDLQQENEKLKSELIQLDTLKEENRQLKLFEEKAEYFRRLQVDPRDLDVFVTNKAEIQHYLKIVPMLHEQNEKMKERLASLGFAMALESIPRLKRGQKSSGCLSDEIDTTYAQGSAAPSQQKTPFSRAFGGRSASDPTSSSPFTQRSRKRQRVDSPLPNEMQIDPPSSRDAMPPPPKPPQKKDSSSKMFPSLRQRFFRNRPADGFQEQSEELPDALPTQNLYAQQEIVHDAGARAYMSGALPAGLSAENDPGSSAPGFANDNGSNFTFRASSALKMSHPHIISPSKQLPKEPSYLSLMDGLSQNALLELNLQDPRKSSTSEHVSSEGHYAPSLGHSSKHTIQRKPLQPLQPSNSFDRSTTGLGPGYTTPKHRRSNMQSSTPASSRHRHPGPQVDRVVSSPFFDINRHRNPIQNAPTAESQHSSTSSGAYPSKRLTIRDPRQNTYETHSSLNGLSFFDTPMNTRNEPIQANHFRREGTASSQHFTRGRSFIDRLNIGRSSRNNYADTQRALPQGQLYSNIVNGYARMNLPASSYRGIVSSHSGNNVGHVSNSMSGMSPTRGKQPWETLQRAGVRSSRRVVSSAVGDAPPFSSSSRGVYSRAGRWRVNR